MVQTDVNEKRYPVNVSPESGNAVASRALKKSRHGEIP